METPSIPDNDGEFCWELDVEIQFRLEECHVFTVCMEIAAHTNKLLNSSFPPFTIK